MTMEYTEFIESKTQLGGMTGFNPHWIPDFLFDFQKYLVDWSIRKGCCATLADCGLGKGLRPDCPVLTPKGFVPLGSLSVGDNVIGSDGKETKITGVFPRGIQPLYQVTFSDQSSVVCDSDHLWNVKSQNDKSRGKDWRTLSTEELSKSNLRYGHDGKSRTWHIPMVDPVRYPKQQLPIDPYFLGVLLGDGSICNNSVSWCKNDAEISERICQVIPDELELVRVDSEERATVWKVVGVKGKPNKVMGYLRDLGLSESRSWEKFVPEQYLISDVDDRIALLQGLMDTDGYAGESPEFTSSSEKLALAVRCIVESLGGTASISIKEHPTYTYKEELRTGRPCYRVVMTLPQFVNPFHLKRKADKYRTASRGLGRWIDSIERCGEGETICIKVEAENGLFVIDRHIVTHNTILQLVWAENIVRETNKPVLILTPLAVASQTAREAEKFGIECQVSRDGKATSKIVVTNYERLHYFNPSDYVGAVCDESSAIKHMDAKRTRGITEFMRLLPYRFLCTATPAPNDYVELGTSAEALGEMGFQDMVTKFFKKNTKGGQHGWARLKYELKGHAHKDFWRWVCSWARAVRKPSDLGFEDGKFELPELITHEHVVEAKTKRPGFLFDMPAITLEEQREERRRSMPERCEQVAELVKDKEISLVWCHLNNEGDLLEKIIPDAVQVSGSDSDEKKEELFLAFSLGQIKRLVTKPVLAGWGLNFQVCNHETFFPSHSFEQYYQGVRRCWRFGQTKPVTVDIVTSEGERGVLENLQRKADAADVLFSKLVELMNDHLKIARSNPFTKQSTLPSWLVNN
jgi:hypothetical protein